MASLSNKSTNKALPSRAGATRISTSQSSRSATSDKPLPGVKRALPPSPPAVPVKIPSSLPRQRAVTLTSVQKPIAVVATRSSPAVPSKTGRSPPSTVKKGMASDKNGSRDSEKSTRQSSSVPRGFKLRQVRETLQKPLASRKSGGSLHSTKPEAAQQSTEPPPQASAAKQRGFFLERKINMTRLSAQNPVIVVIPSNVTSRESSHHGKGTHRSRFPVLSSTVGRRLPLKAKSVDKVASQAVRSLDAFISHSHKVIRGQGTPTSSRDPSPRRARPTETKKLSLIPSHEDTPRKHEGGTRRTWRLIPPHGADRDDENVLQRGRTTTRNHVKELIKVEARPGFSGQHHQRSSSDHNNVGKSTLPAMTTASTNKQLPACPGQSQEFNATLEGSGRELMDQSSLFSRQSSTSSAYSIVIQPSMSRSGTPIDESARTGNATKHIMDEDLPPRIRHIMLQARRHNMQQDHSNTGSNVTNSEADSESGSSGLLRSDLDPDDCMLPSHARSEGQSLFHDDVTLTIEALRNFDRTSYGGLGSIAI